MKDQIFFRRLPNHGVRLRDFDSQLLYDMY